MGRSCALSFLDDFRCCPSDCMNSLDEELAKSLGNALDLITGTNPDHHVDALVEELECTNASLGALVDQAHVHIVLINERAPVEQASLIDLAIERELHLCDRLQQVDASIAATQELLDDVDERSKLAVDTVLNMRALHLDQMPSPIGCDLKVLRSERADVQSELDGMRSLNSCLTDSVAAVRELRLMLVSPLHLDKAPPFGIMADLLGQIDQASAITDRVQQRMLALVNGMAADRMLLIKLDAFTAKIVAARCAVQLRVVEVVSRFWS